MNCSGYIMQVLTAVIRFNIRRRKNWSSFKYWLNPEVASYSQEYSLKNCFSFVLSPLTDKRSSFCAQLDTKWNVYCLNCFALSEAWVALSLPFKSIFSHRLLTPSLACRKFNSFPFTPTQLLSLHKPNFFIGAFCTTYSLRLTFPKVGNGGWRRRLNVVWRFAVSSARRFWPWP